MSDVPAWRLFEIVYEREQHKLFREARMMQHGAPRKLTPSGRAGQKKTLRLNLRYEEPESGTGSEFVRYLTIGESEGRHGSADITLGPKTNAVTEIGNAAARIMKQLHDDILND